jgi:hypothetical protein
MNLLGMKRKLLPLGSPQGGKGGGGGGSAPPPSSQTVTNTSIPEYARPYVERMLGKTEAITDINQNPYQAYGGERIQGFNENQQRAFANVFNQAPASQLGTATNLAGQAGLGAIGMQGQAGQLGQEALGYGATGQMYGGMGAEQAMQRAQQTARQAGMYGGMGAGIGGMGVQAAQQGFGAGEQFARQATDPRAMQAYMSPYMQNAVDFQKSEAIRDFNIGQQAQKARAVGSGAFGGSRQAIVESEAQRNLGTQLGGIQATGTQKAFEDAQRQQQFGAQLGLQGLQAGYGGLGVGMQGAQTGLQGVGQQLAAGQLGLQGTAQGMQGAGYGLQGVQAATGAGQLGLQGLGQATQAASTLGQLGQTQFGQEQAISAEQQKVGAIQQAQAQQGLDLAYQDFLKQRNYPYQQLAFQSDMLRGLPLSQSARSIYEAPPSMASQLGGLGMSALGIYGQSGGFRAKGGMVGKGYANGGLMAAQRFQTGGSIDSGKIDLMTAEQLTSLLDNPSLSPLEVDMIENRLMLLNRMSNNPASAEIMGSGIDSIPTGDMVPEQMAGGGIVAFAQGGKSEEDYRSFLESQVRKSIENQMSGDAFNRSAEDKAAIAQNLKERKENKLYEFLANVGAGTAAGTSQYGLSNFGAALNQGMKTYGQSLDKDTADQLKLLDAQLYADKAEDARRSGLTGQMQTTLGQMYSKDAALAAARASAGDPESKLNAKAEALIARDPFIKGFLAKKLYLTAGTPEYADNELRIAERQNDIYTSLGVKNVEAKPSRIPEYVKPEEPSFLSKLNPFSSSKPAAPARTPGTMKFDKDGNPV